MDFGNIVAKMINAQQDDAHEFQRNLREEKELRVAEVIAHRMAKNRLNLITDGSSLPRVIWRATSLVACFIWYMKNNKVIDFSPPPSYSYQTTNTTRRDIAWGIHY